MPVVSYRKKVWKRRKRRLVPHKRLFKVKSIIPKRRVYIRKGKPYVFKIRPSRTRMFRRFNLWVIPKYQKPFKQEYTPKKKPSQKSISSGRTKKDWGKVWQTTAYKKLYKPKDTGRFPAELGQWYKDLYEKEWLKRGKGAKKESQPLPKEYKNWGGKREYEWKGVNYGKMKPLGPKLIFEVFPTHKYYMYIRARKSYGDHMKVIMAIRKAMQKVIDDLAAIAEIRINKYVPKETGDLRKAMIDSIKNSKVRGMTIKVELDTGNIQYANPVNNMPQSKIRHSMKKSKQSGRRSGELLHDPKAVEGWFQFITMILNKEAGKLLITMIEEIMAAFSFRYFKKKAKLQKPKPITQTYTYMTRDIVGSRLKSNRDQLIAYYKKNLPLLTREMIERRIDQGAHMGEPYKVVREATIKPTIEDLEMEKHKRMMAYRIDYEKAHKESTLVEYPRKLIMEMFKIKGLYKGNKVY